MSETQLPRMGDRRLTFVQIQFENSKLRQRVRKLEEELRLIKKMSSKTEKEQTNDKA